MSAANADQLNRSSALPGLSSLQFVANNRKLFEPGCLFRHLRIKQATLPLRQRRRMPSFARHSFFK